MHQGEDQGSWSETESPIKNLTVYGSRCRFRRTISWEFSSYFLLSFCTKVDFGNQIGYILLTSLVACATGITFGAFVSAIVKKSEGLKTAILIVFTMVCAFLAGMMFDQMKYIVEKNIPILAYLNPVTLITDAFYALYYYDTHTRFFINIGLLGGFTVLFSLVTYLIIRRQRYASI